jgi:type II secretory pathway component PulM
MWAVASPYYMGLRKAVEDPRSDGQAPMTWEAMHVQLDSRRPEILLGAGTIGLLLLVWLMVIKPGG